MNPKSEKSRTAGKKKKKSRKAAPSKAKKAKTAKPGKAPGSKSVKPKVAFFWCASCGGCEEAVVDLNEKILDVVAAVDIIFWPVALDFKYSDLKKMAENEIAVSFINGAVRLTEQEEIVRLLREKSALVVSFGSCSHLGGIPGLANFFSREEILKRAYEEAPSLESENKAVPQTESVLDGRKFALDEFYEEVFPLDKVIDVDYYLPGCAPAPDLIADAVGAILEGKLPPRGSVLSPGKPLCDECERKKPEKIKIKEVKRPHLTLMDPERCFLEDGIICMGPATRSGCGTRCINANMPCRGCFGPAEGVRDLGAGMLSAFASIIDSEDEKEIEEIVETICDVGGTFYRFSLASSTIPKKKK
jgi:F420-non-reducing hydrogenase small subunit